ncbi:MAG: MoaD/ThiS family protein [Undibacterium sp.]|nr:MoaD/ThiS family protein [Undibacterium sp.]
MKIQLKFFASIREKLACSSEVLELANTPYTAQEVRQLLIARSAIWADALSLERPVRMACNHQMLVQDVALKDGDELAFFPPVTGG